jgi:hypothetical protein
MDYSCTDENKDPNKAYTHVSNGASSVAKLSAQQSCGIIQGQL